MAAGMVLSVSQTLFAALQCSALKEVCSMFGYTSQLEELKGTVCTIKAVLLDVDSKQGELPHGARDWIEKLKDAVYDVDDLFDEYNTIIERRKLQDQLDGGKISKVSKKVRRFFSRSNKLVVAFNMSLDIKHIQNKLADIASDHNKFGFNVNYEPIRKTREETGSYVRESSIVGREGDKEAVMNLLLQDSDVQENISFVTIIGIGGLGKTALAQLIYNDDRIKSAFDLRLWVCVSEEFGMRGILSKMLMSTTNQKGDDLGVDLLQLKVREHIEGRRYFLVLDDVWAENHDEWVRLNDFLVTGGRGSRILVTSRSKLVARAIGKYPMYDLPGLSDDDSWRLFVQMAFGDGEERADLVDVGKKIIKKCANVPLSIRVVGSMLYGQDESRWWDLKDANLAKIKGSEVDTMSILKFSYHHLTSSLKSCFSYCALYPKDHVIEKEEIMSLWLAHGCIELRFEGQSVESAGEEHFFILLNRCFFQDIRKDLNDVNILAFKIHDLMHDLAQEVAGNESFILSSTRQHSIQKYRHLSILGGCQALFNLNEYLTQTKKMRTFLQIYDNGVAENVYDSSIPLILSHCRHLRVLDLRSLESKTLPSSIGELVHLRYLNLSDSDTLEVLPEAISKLHNLHMLNLAWCRKLKVLPRGFSKLVNLRHLDTKNCFDLTYMPAGISKLTCLQKLTRFVVGETNPRERAVQLEDLKALTDLRGKLCIIVRRSCSLDASNVREGGYLLSKLHLSNVRIEFDGEDEKENVVGVEEAVLEGLQPNRALQVFSIRCYKGEKLPRGGIEHLTHLRSLGIEECVNLVLEDEDDGMPWKPLGRLSSLTLWHLPKLVNLPKGMQYLTGLQSLEIGSCDNLTSLPEWLSCLTSLQSLDIGYCSKLISLPEAIRHLPSLSQLEIYKCNHELMENCSGPDGEEWPKICHIPQLKFEQKVTLELMRMTLKMVCLS